MKKNYILPLFLIVQIIGLQLISLFPECVEQWYSNGLYVFISKVSRIILGYIPFSVGDCFYFFLILYFIFWFYTNRKETFKAKIIKVVSCISVIYFLFHFLWGFNYYRIPLFQKMNIKREYSDSQLLKFTEKLIEKTNTVHLSITGNSNTKVSLPYTDKTIFDKAPDGYATLSKKHAFFSYSNPSIKTSLFSNPLTYMGFGGYLNPFTNEAQVNHLPPKYSFPATTCHEMAHQIGYASESECNFIGFLACINHEDLYFNYAGYSYALRYCLSNIRAKDESKFDKIIKTINPGIIKNFKESDSFWESRHTFIDTAFETFYDNFLKMNQQKEGIESYSKFVDLLINYYSNSTSI